MSDVIEAVGLTRRYGRLEAVDRLNIRVPAGSIFALIGPNGAGKTTTIKLLMNLIRPSSGVSTVVGVDSRRLRARDFQRIGFVSEKQCVPEWMTPGMLFDWCRPLYPTWDEALCHKLAADLRLPLSARIRTLSRGARMKTALMAALAFRPELVVLDEPFSGLDPLVRDELTRALLELAADRRCSVFVSSHDIEELERLADWIGFIDRGRLIFAEPVSSLLDRFRLVEVIAHDGAAIESPMPADWLMQGAAGRTLRFIDTNHDQAAQTRIASIWPNAHVAVSPLSLREIFVALASQPARDAVAGGAS